MIINIIYSNQELMRIMNERRELQNAVKDNEFNLMMLCVSLCVNCIFVGAAVWCWG